MKTLEIKSGLKYGYQLSLMLFGLGLFMSVGGCIQNEKKDDSAGNGAAVSEPTAPAVPDAPIPEPQNNAPVISAFEPAAFEAATDIQDVDIFARIQANDKDGDVLSYEWTAEVQNEEIPLENRSPIQSLRSAIKVLDEKLGDNIEVQLIATVKDSKGASAEKRWRVPFRRQAVYVATTGEDTVGNGTMKQPLKTIRVALALAEQRGLKQVRVAQGQYRETALRLSDGVSILGSFNDANNWSRNAAQRSTVLSVDPRGVFIKDIRSNTEVSGLTIIADDASMPSQSSYGLRIINSTRLLFMNNRIRSGKGAAGINGANGMPGLYGFDGFAGTNSTDANGARGAFAVASPCGVIGAAGGRGGNAGEAGFVGSNSSSFSGIAFGGAGGTSGNSGADAGKGASGQNGTNGSSGASGASSSPFGVVVAEEWVPLNASNGGDGVHGMGGAGGGGGGGYRSIFETDKGGAGGGSGGTGGCAGTGGKAGVGGGASIAVFVASSEVTFTGNQIETSAAGKGGSGGRGGIGGTGGLGGVGGVAVSPAGNGGNGGRGGNGGTGGNGGSGAGGLAAGFLVTGQGTFVQTGNVFMIAQPALGGEGPNVGATGISTPVRNQ